MSEPIRAVKRQLADACSFVDIFGALPKGTTTEQLRVLRKRFGYLASIVHPDKARGAEDEAGPVFTELKVRYDRAQAAVKSGRYENETISSSASDSGSTRSVGVFTTARGTIYTLHSSVYTEGDFSTIYRAESSADGPVLVKVAADPRVNAYLEQEAKILKRFQSEKKLESIKRFVPVLLETFLAPGEDGRQYRALAFPYQEGYLSLTEIKNAFPDGLPPEDAAWVWRRVLGQTLAANMAGFVHGAIVPDHVLVHPITHEPLHIGWAHAVKEPWKHHSRITLCIDRWREWYPPEVLKKQAPDHCTDLYMAGKMMVYLLGGDIRKNTLPRTVPEDIRRIILRTVRSSLSDRASDGLSVLNAFTAAIKRHWGRKYRRLILPS